MDFYLRTLLKVYTLDVKGASNDFLKLLIFER
jgi:hypothetical protein